MACHGIRGAKRRGKPWRTTKQDPAGRHAPDLVERDFTAEQPNRLWVADFTYLRCWEGVVFFAFVLDVFSRMVVGWQLACHLRDDLVLDALRMALGLRAPGADSRWCTTPTAARKADSSGRRKTLSERSCGGQEKTSFGSCDESSDAFAGAAAGVA
jgi:transposase InsO family protein